MVSVDLQGVRELIAGKSNDLKVLAAIDKIVGLALLLSPAYLGPAGAAGLALIDPKNEAVALVRSTITAHRKGIPFTEKCDRLAAAYCLSSFAAFFTALDETLPDVKRLMDLSDAEKAVIVAESSDLLQHQDPADYGQYRMRLPGSVQTVTLEEAARRSLYERLTAGTRRFLHGLATWESLDGSGQNRVEKSMSELADRAESAFQGQYLSLVAEFPEFLAWDNVRNRAEILARLTEMKFEVTDEMRKFATVAETLDVGLEKLDDLVKSLSASQETNAIQRTATDLHSLYVKAIDRPVIVDVSRDDAEDLTYPTKSRAYLPQAFKATQVDSSGSNLEDEARWRDLEEQQDIGAFIVGYLQNPESIQSPLLLLGQPGSGKSLLTEMLAARLAPPAFNTIRVPLRDVHPDDSLQTQIEKRIKADTGRSVDWAGLAEQSVTTPPLVILDGFDELLQATGRVFGTYLEKVADFQQREADLGRPLRVIITSRVSLIDRARVPAGSTVIRLQEFDRDRRDRWATVWNAVNRDYFERTRTRPFAVPTDARLLHLAEQPLLLLMLAVYDSQGNALAGGEAISQTTLYHNLLARFLRRERNKGAGADAFQSLAPARQEELIEQDLSRLGVAALGMYNRQAVHIARDQLDADIAFFGTSVGMEVSGGVALGEADLLLGSFFFIHEAKAAVGEVAGDDRPAAFEFLHNTFGEFLTADFALRHLLAKLTLLSKLSGDPSLSSALHDSLDKVSPQLLACLTHTSLASRPVILSMVAEWGEARKSSAGLDDHQFLQALNDFVTRQLQRVLCDGSSPSLKDESGLTPLPAMGQMAVFTLNLVLLRTLLSKQGFAWDNARFLSGDGVSAWERLTHLWRGWFSLESLGELASAVHTEIVDGSPVMRRASSAGGEPAPTRLRLTADVADVLGDSVPAGLARLLLWEETSATIGVRSSTLAASFDRLTQGGIEAPIVERIRHGWLDASAPGVPLALPAAASTLLTQLAAAQRNASTFRRIREKLGPKQWSVTDTRTIDTWTIACLLDLNAAVEPRFIHHILAELRGKWPSIDEYLEESQLEVLFTAALAYWHQPSVRVMLVRLSEDLPSAIESFSRPGLVACFGILAGRLELRDLENRAISHLALLVRSNSSALQELSLRQLDGLLDLLLIRLPDSLSGHSIVRRALVGSVDRRSGGFATDLPTSFVVRTERLRAPSRKAASGSRPTGPRNRLMGAGAYAIESTDIPELLVWLHQRNDVAGITAVFRESTRPIEGALLKRQLSTLREGLRWRQLTQDEEAAFDWAIDSVRDEAVDAAVDGGVSKGLPAEAPE
jgi:hypothetical protein